MAAPIDCGRIPSARARLDTVAGPSFRAKQHGHLRRREVAGVRLLAQPALQLAGQGAELRCQGGGAGGLGAIRLIVHAGPYDRYEAYL